MHLNTAKAIRFKSIDGLLQSQYKSDSKCILKAMQNDYAYTTQFKSLILHV